MRVFFAIKLIEVNGEYSAATVVPALCVTKAVPTVTSEHFLRGGLDRKPRKALSLEFFIRAFLIFVQRVLEGLEVEGFFAGVKKTFSFEAE
jgi:hypothetical protein